MSEKIYAFLLRLFPAHFREAYREEALQLFRDRYRDEKGLFRRLRLWLDLAADLVISLPREYFHPQPELAGAAAHEHLRGTPSFYVSGDELPRPGALILGGVLSLGALVAVSILLGQGGSRGPLRASARQRLLSSEARSSAIGRAGPQSDDATEGEAVVSGLSARSASAESAPSAATLATKATIPSNSLSEPPLTTDSSASSQPQDLQSQFRQPQDTASTMIAATVDSATLNAAEQQRVIAGVIASLKKYYVYPDVAQKMADALTAHEKSGDYHSAMGGRAFADLLTRHVRDVSQDLHLEVVYSTTPLPEHPMGPTAEGLALYRKAMEEENCTFEKAEILPHNIGYLKLNSFPDTSVCQAKAAAVMASLNDVDAIIFDLRDNRGGFPDMVMMISSYLFDHPEYMYSPRENTSEGSWTRSPVPGNKLADKPVYVLISARTFSGAEHFSYDLKMLKRGTLVGETTGGATDVGAFHRIDDHFGIGIRETRGINPYAEPDWAVTGVAPDVKVKAKDALEAAIKLADSKLRKK